MFSVLNLLDTMEERCAFLRFDKETDITYCLNWIEQNVPNTNVKEHGLKSKHMVQYFKHLKEENVISEFKWDSGRRPRLSNLSRREQEHPNQKHMRGTKLVLYGHTTSFTSGKTDIIDATKTNKNIPQMHPIDILRYNALDPLIEGNTRVVLPLQDGNDPFAKRVKKRRHKANKRKREVAKPQTFLSTQLLGSAMVKQKEKYICLTPESY